jgi:hypothetical protein
MTGFYNRDGVFLLRGTDWVFIYIPLNPSGHYMYHQFNINKLYVLPTQCIYVFCADLRTNRNYFPIQRYLTGFFIKETECVYCAVRTECFYIRSEERRVG